MEQFKIPVKSIRVAFGSGNRNTAYSPNACAGRPNDACTVSLDGSTVMCYTGSAVECACMTIDSRSDSSAGCLRCVRGRRARRRAAACRRAQHRRGPSGHQRDDRCLPNVCGLPVSRGGRVSLPCASGVGWSTQRTCLPPAPPTDGPFDRASHVRSCSRYFCSLRVRLCLGNRSGKHSEQGQKRIHTSGQALPLQSSPPLPPPHSRLTVKQGSAIQKERQ